MKSRIGIVILNYNKYEETIECVNSVLAQSYINKKIYIVDNGSTNESYLRIQQEYKKNLDVVIIKNDYNLGFANGNNVGIIKAREEQCEYVLVLNSDTIFTSENILNQIIAENENFVGIINLKCCNRDGSYQNKSFSPQNSIYIYG